jgi:large subunit ribosomal protein L30
MAVTLKIQWIKSAIGYRKDQADTIRSLGFRKLNQTVERPDTKVFRGMINKVRHLVRVIEEDATS